MAFRIETNLEGYEYRATRTGTGRDSGNPWVSIVLESEGGEQVDVSVPSELQGQVMGLGLRKGDYLSCRVLACSTQSYSFVRLLDVPQVVSGYAQDVQY